MKASVTLMYKKGQPVPRESKHVVLIGEIWVNELKNPLTGKLEKTARIDCADGRALHTCTLDEMAKAGFLLRGYELELGRMYLQEWFVRLGDFQEIA